MKPKQALTLAALISLTIMLTSPVSISYDVQLTTDLADDWSPAITQTNDGRIWIVWHSFRTGNGDIFYKTFNGTSWTNATQLTTDPNVDGLPSILQATDGTIWVVWTSNRYGNFDIFYKTSTDNGNTWTNATQLTTHTSDDRHPSVTQSFDGKIWIVWQSRRTGNVDIFYKTFDGVSWTNATQLTTDENDDKDPTIIQRSDEAVWVLWASNRYGNFDIFCKTSTDNGNTWTNETQLTTDPGFDHFPSVIQATDGTMWLVWQSDRNIQDDIYYQIYDGSAWSGENQLTWYMDQDITPSIFQAANEETWLVWSSDKHDNFDIYYKLVTIDIVIQDAHAFPPVADQGDLVDIYVEIRNEGTAGATFNVTVCYNETVIGTQRKTLIPSPMSRQLTFSWNTTDIPAGNYAISARATTVPGEIDITNNEYVDGLITVVIRDFAIGSVTTSRTLAYQGHTTIYVYVEVRNDGTLTDTIDVTTYHNSTSIGTRTVTLTPGANTTLIFPWHTSDVHYGHYTISAYVAPVPMEKDLSDNSLTDGTVTVTIPGDVNFDRTLNILDAAVISAHWYPGPPIGLLGYDLNVDINNDGKINILDAAIVSANWQKSW